MKLDTNKKIAFAGFRLKSCFKLQSFNLIALRMTFSSIQKYNLCDMNRINKHWQMIGFREILFGVENCMKFQKVTTLLIFIEWSNDPKLKA